MMTKKWKWLLAVVFGFTLAVLFLRTFALAPNVVADQDQDEDDEQEAIHPQSHVSIQNGRTILTLSARDQSLAGIIVAPLKPFISRAEITAPATVLSAQSLVAARAQYLSALENIEKLTVQRDVAQQECLRLEALYKDQENASQKSVQAAQALVRVDDLEIQAERQQLKLQIETLRQAWGSTISDWTVEDPPQLESLLSAREALVQVTFPGKYTGAVPRNIELQLTGSRQFGAAFVSRFPRVDARIQGLSLLYITQVGEGIAPGMNLVARVPSGHVHHGVLIPISALLWWQGNAWIYERSSSNQFTRLRVIGGIPQSQDIFVSSGFSPGEQVVVQGAQALLSEEFRSQIQPED